MTTESISKEVRRTIDTLTVDRADDPVEVLFVEQKTVWLVVAPERIESEDAMIDIFQALETVPSVESLYVERADVDRPAYRSAQ